MKRSILCLLVLLTLCVCILFVSCKKEDPALDAPDAAGVGKKGESQTQKIPGQVEIDAPNEQLPGWTNRPGNN